MPVLGCVIGESRECRSDALTVGDACGCATSCRVPRVQEGLVQKHVSGDLFAFPNEPSRELQPTAIHLEISRLVHDVGSLYT